MLRFNSLYASFATEDQSGASSQAYRDYFRFYEDGRVLSVVSIGNPTQVARWLHEEKEGLSWGAYRIEGEHIAFETQHPCAPDDPRDELFGRAEMVVVSYEGIISEDVLELHSHSHFNGHRSYAIYAFVSVPLI